MKTNRGRHLAGIVVWLAATAAQAGSSIDVGRITLKLAEDGWQAREVPAEPVRLSGGGGIESIPAVAKLLTLRGPDGKFAAALYVYTTRGTQIRMYSSGKCGSSPDPHVYVRALSGTRLESPECLSVSGLYDGSAIVPQMLYMKTVASDLGSDVPPAVYVLSAFLANSSGANIHVEGLLGAGFAGLDGVAPKAEAPSALNPAVVAWADAFGEAAQSAMRSISGSLEVPPLRFK